MAKNFLSEDDIEQALLQKLQHLHGFDVLDCFTAKADDINDESKRRDERDVLITCDADLLVMAEACTFSIEIPANSYQRMQGMK